MRPSVSDPAEYIRQDRSQKDSPGRDELVLRPVAAVLFKPL
jgi:hypothetical protein